MDLLLRLAGDAIIAGGITDGLAERVNRFSYLRPLHITSAQIIVRLGHGREILTAFWKNGIARSGSPIPAARNAPIA